MSNDAMTRVRELLSQREGAYRRSAWGWKAGYRALLLTSALFSTAAAIIGKLEYYQLARATDAAAMLAAGAAVITTLIAALDFEVNWRINRRARHEVAVIGLESEKSDAKPDDLLTKLQEVVKRRIEDLNRRE